MGLFIVILCSYSIRILFTLKKVGRNFCVALCLLCLENCFMDFGIRDEHGQLYKVVAQMKTKRKMRILSRKSWCVVRISMSLSFSNAMVVKFAYYLNPK